MLHIIIKSIFNNFFKSATKLCHSFFQNEYELLLTQNSDLCSRINTKFPLKRPVGIVLLHSLQMRILLENTAFPLCKINGMELLEFWILFK